MGRHQVENRNIGKDYGDDEYNLIFFLAIRGMPKTDIAILFKRSLSGIEKCLNRLCYNASAKPYERTYRLFPLITRETNLSTQFAKDYVCIQFFDQHINAKPEDLANRMGVPLDKIYDFINSMKRTNVEVKPSLDLF